MDIRTSRYEKRKRRSDPSIATYHFVGYSSLYPFYCFPERVRMRIRCVFSYGLHLISGQIAGIAGSRRRRARNETERGA